MRILPQTLAALFLATPALASSIEPVTGPTVSAGSIAVLSCDACPPLKPKPKSETYHVEAIAPGTQKLEIREENGERKLYRTEAWMGGSPVVFVTKVRDEPVNVAGKVDADAHTGALDTSAAAGAVTASAAGSREFDPAGFALRKE